VDERRVEHLADLPRIGRGELSFDTARVFCRGCSADRLCRLGLDLRRDEPARGVRGTVVFPEWSEGGGGAVHGGMVMAALDEILSAVHLSAGRLGITVTFAASFHRPVPITTTLTVRGWLTSETGDRSRVEGSISSGKGVLASASGDYVVRDPVGHYTRAREKASE
jgi:acyl-coenzyme A thioesterase PaaI-like protein